MKDLVIIGAGAFGREVAQLVEEINQYKKMWNFIGYIDETEEKQGKSINGDMVLGDFNWLDKIDTKNIWGVCAIGNTMDKFKLVNKAKVYNIKFANLIHPSVRLNNYIQIGHGNIICANSILSVNTRIGNHVAINPTGGIGHDAIIGDYSTLYWNVTLGGYVKLNEGCEIGSKSVVLPNTTIGKWTILGAGAVVIKDIPEYSTAVGVPAKVIKTNKY